MDRGTDRSLRRRRWLVTLIVLLAVVSPALRDRDSFPLSTYPMYAHTRADTAEFSTVVGVDARGSRVPLSLSAIAGTDDALIGQSRVRRALAAAQHGALCADVAERVPDEIDRLEVVTERHELVALVRGEASLIDRTLHATCETT